MDEFNGMDKRNKYKQSESNKSQWFNDILGDVLGWWP
jgi:hypothetical protein